MQKLKYDAVRWSRILALVLLDILSINAAVLLSLVVRYEFSLMDLAESQFVQQYFRIAPAYTAAALVLFGIFRLYRSLWEHASIEELPFIIFSALSSALALVIIQTAAGIYLPRSLPVLNMGFLLALVGGTRYAYRFLRRLRSKPQEQRRRTMLIGAGSAGAMTLKELEHSAHSENKVVCIIDDDPRKQGSYLLGVPVVGTRQRIGECAEKYRVDDIILAIPAASAKDRREIVALCQETDCRLRTLPAIYQIANGQVSLKQLRDVAVEDLLGRDKVRVESGQIGAYLSGKTVLVTGGGGSIGSELCRQIARYRPETLIIFDIYENNAYDIQQELRFTHPELKLEVLIGSVRDRERVDQIFRDYRPQIVCHAAAHKHVPLMEDSPAEAVKNNIFGTLHTAQAADKYGAEKFILISSDKAVNPTNMMGASKRVCEMIVQVLGQKSPTTFAAVRFGNVLGSNGSVIPLFRKQIERGGPVTVTHPEIIRYFMTISEAVSLVLQACAYAKGGEVFVLDMGDPVRIDELARNMIRLSGFEPDVDIHIEYTGLRPGEKLYEELMMQDEGLDRTPNELIFVGHFNDFDPDELLRALEELGSAARQNDPELRSMMRRLVRTYRPTATTCTTTETRV